MHARDNLVPRLFRVRRALLKQTNMNTDSRRFTAVKSWQEKDLSNLVKCTQLQNKIFQK